GEDGAGVPVPVGATLVVELERAGDVPDGDALLELVPFPPAPPSPGLPGRQYTTCWLSSDGCATSSPPKARRKSRARFLVCRTVTSWMVCTACGTSVADAGWNSVMRKTNPTGRDLKSNMKMVQ
ncbi:hypothetical protein C0992_000995, partial [Termitomyces sp. T32_za158]